MTITTERCIVAIGRMEYARDALGIRVATLGVAPPTLAVYGLRILPAVGKAARDVAGRFLHPQTLGRRPAVLDHEAVAQAELQLDVGGKDRHGGSQQRGGEQSEQDGAKECMRHRDLLGRVREDTS